MAAFWISAFAGAGLACLSIGLINLSSTSHLTREANVAKYNSLVDVRIFRKIYLLLI